MAAIEETRVEEFQFGPRRSACSAERCAFWDLHTPVVRAWIEEMQRAGDEWWQSAEHAAFCLVSAREHALNGEELLHWDDFDVEEFLFLDLSMGGTVGIYGSVSIFFDHVVQAFERFIAAGIITADKGATWLAQMRASRARFLEKYRDCEMEIEEVYGVEDTLRALHERDRDLWG